MAVDSIEDPLGSVVLVLDATAAEDEPSGIDDGSRDSGSRETVRAKGYEAPVNLAE